MRTLTTLLSLTALFASGCVIVDGNGRLETETRAVRSFTSVENRSWLAMSVQQGAGGDAIVRCDSNLLAHIETFVQGETFIVQIEPGFQVGRSGACTIELTTSELTEIASAGSGATSACGDFAGFRRASISGSGNLGLCGVSGDIIDISSSGSGELSIGELAANEVEVSHSGSGNVRIEGSTDFLSIDSSGSGATETFSLPCQSAQVHNSGSGAIEVDATDTINGSLSGSGDLRVRGNASVRVDTTGSGRVVYE